ncbi:hypothetical protein ACT79_09015 [Burkholderia pseudomallei]|nr:hypothetical protein ACT79_09015 [Burkholderia pseudomallei]
MLTFNRHTVALDERFACFVAQPLDAALPIVVDSPHSGIAYPPDFGAVVMPESTMPYSATLDCASAGGTAAPIPIPATARLSRFISNLLRRFVCRPRAFAPPATCFIN